MRISRRALLAGGAGALALGLGLHAANSRPRGADDSSDLAIEATPIPHLLPGAPTQTRFGALTYRGGLALTSAYPSFGGLSALWRSSDGTSLVSLSDNAMWLTARPVYAAGRLAGLEAARMAPLLDADGTPLWRTKAYDTESLAIADGVAFVGIERVHEVRRFAWAAQGVSARGEPVAVPPEVKTLPDNESLEAVGIVPCGQPLAGALFAIAERSRTGDDTPTRGWILTGPETGAFDVVRSHAFDITDITFLASGAALLLERRFNLIDGVACRIRRIAANAIRPGATVDGEVIFEADRRHEIDNMEGIATHRDPASGELVVTLVSDDNFNHRLQRNLLLEFTLA